MDTRDELRQRAMDAKLEATEGRVFRPSQYAIELEWERVKVMRSLTTLDVGDELCDEDVVAVIKTGDPVAVGRVVLAKINAWADRVAARAVDV